MTEELNKQILDLINDDNYDKIDLTKVIELIEQGGDVNIRNDIGESAIFIAISTKRLDLVENLIELGADLSKQNHYEQTALHVALDEDDNDVALDEERNDIALAIAMAEKDINNLTNNEGETPVWIALYRGFFDVVDILLDKGVDVNVGKKDIVANAVLSGNTEMVAGVIAAGGDVNERSDNYTPIYYALNDEFGDDNSIKIAALLLLYQADISDIDIDDENLIKAQNVLKLAMQEYKQALGSSSLDDLKKMSAEDMLTLCSYMKIDNETTIANNNMSMSVSNASAQQHVDEPQAKRAKYL
jgi:ankyrin repeat protein